MSNRPPSISQMERALMEAGYDINDPEFRNSVLAVQEQAAKEIQAPEIPVEHRISPELEHVISTLHAWSRIGNLLQNVIATGILGLFINIVLIIADFLRLRDVVATFENNAFVAGIMSLAIVGLYTYLAFNKADKHYMLNADAVPRRSLRLTFGSLFYYLGISKHWYAQKVSRDEIEYRQAARTHSLLKWIIFVVLIIHTITTVYTTQTISPDKVLYTIGSSIVGVAITLGLLIGLEMQIDWAYHRYMKIDGKEIVSADFLVEQRKSYSAEVERARQRAYGNLLYQTLVMVKQQAQNSNLQT